MFLNVCCDLIFKALFSGDFLKMISPKKLEKLTNTFKWLHPPLIISLNTPPRPYKLFNGLVFDIGSFNKPRKSKLKSLDKTYLRGPRDVLYIHRTKFLKNTHIGIVHVFLTLI